MTGEDSGVTEPFTELAAGSVQLHEWFLTLCGAGFTPIEALYFMAQIVRRQPEGQ